ncbi:MAG: MMPL family transporter, partial [Nakamurella sp.]
MAVLLYRLGRFATRRRGLVLAVWLVLLAVVGGTAGLAGGKFSDSFSIPDTPAQNAIDQLSAQIPGAGGSTGRIVFEAPAGRSLTEADYQPTVQRIVAAAVKLPGVTAATDPFTGQILLPAGTAPENPSAQPQLAPPTGRIGFATLQMQGQVTEVPAATHDALAGLAATAGGTGVTVELSGAAVKQAPAIGSTEGIGVIVALVVLLIMFGSIVAAGLPMLTALIGIGIGVSGVLITANWIDMSSTAPILALMLGLAVGIDYALFIVTRHRKQLIAGMEIRESIARANGTAGSAVVFAGLTVIIALAALSVVGIPFLTVMGVAASATVLIAVLIAVTLLPALLAFAGPKVLGRKQRELMGLGRHAVERQQHGDPDRANRWGRFVTRYPALVLVVGVLALGAAAIPTTQLHLGLPDDGSKPLDSTARQAYDLLAEGFGAGMNGPLLLVAELPDGASAGALDQISAAVAETDGVAGVAPATLHAEGDTSVVTVIPTTGPQAAQTVDLVNVLRDGELPGATDGTGVTAHVGGVTATSIDSSDNIAKRLPL